jgi:hypothetical protein
MSPSRHWIVWAALAAATPSLLGAQSTDTTNALRHGFYGSIGVGYGMTRIGADLTGSVEWENASGATYYAAAGFAPNPHLRLGAEWNYIETNDAFSSYFGSGVSATTMFFSVSVTYYPSLKNNFWMKADVGLANLSGARGSLSASEEGLAGGIGVGYDWRIGQSNFVIIPFANYFLQFSPSEFDGVLQGTRDSGTARLLQIGVGAGYRH